MSILVIAATAKEIEPFLKKYRKSNDNLEVVDILVTGIGLTSTAYSLAKQMSIKKPSLVIQAGVAGCFDPAIPLGSTFVIKRDRIADFGVMEGGQFNSVYKMGLVKGSNGWFVNKSQVLKQTRLKKVDAISVNTISTDKQQIADYRREYNPVLESMEGAAMHYVCSKEKIAFLQLRSVSNYIGERNKKNWKLKESIENLNQELILLLSKL